MKRKEKPGVLIYFDLEPALEILNLDQKGRLFSMILEYAHYGVEQNINDEMILVAWAFVKSAIDRDGERYHDVCLQKKISGLKSDFRRNYAPKHNIDPDNEQAMQAYIRRRMATDVEVS